MNIDSYPGIMPDRVALYQIDMRKHILFPDPEREQLIRMNTWRIVQSLRRTQMASSAPKTFAPTFGRDVYRLVVERKREVLGISWRGNLCGTKGRRSNKGMNNKNYIRPAWRINRADLNKN